MTPPLIPLPETIHVQTAPALLMELTQAHREWLPQPPPVLEADPQLVLSRRAFRCNGQACCYPGSSIQRDGCPYRVTSCWDDDHLSLDSPFGVQVPHPQLLEWVGMSESARLQCPAYFRCRFIWRLWVSGGPGGPFGFCASGPPPPPPPPPCPGCPLRHPRPSGW